NVGTVRGYWDLRSNGVLGELAFNLWKASVGGSRCVVLLIQHPNHVVGVEIGRGFIRGIEEVQLYPQERTGGRLCSAAYNLGQLIIVELPNHALTGWISAED